VALEAAADPQPEGSAIRAIALLDAVPWDRTLEAAPKVEVSHILSLRSEPSACNADGSVLRLLALLKGSHDDVRIVGATHCDPEDPTTFPCRLFCGGSNPAAQALYRELLALFLLEMGLIAATQLGALKRNAVFLVLFGVLMPLFGATVGALLGRAIGLSPGGIFVLATLAASASYIAAPTAMRTAVPEANPALSLTASLAITFPFNIIVGIPIYHRLATMIASL
jgi:hypothetical protein